MPLSFFGCNKAIEIDYIKNGNSGKLIRRNVRVVTDISEEPKASLEC